MDELVARWPVTVDLFASALNYRFPVYFSPLSDPMAVGTDTFLQAWDGLQTYAFLPFAPIHQVIKKLVSSKGAFLTLIAPFWLQKEWFPELLSLVVASVVPLPPRRDLLRQPHFRCLHPPEPPRAEPSCMATVQRFMCHLGLPRRVAS